MFRVKLLGLLCSLSALAVSQAPAATVVVMRSDSSPNTIIHGDVGLGNVTKPRAIEAEAVRPSAKRADIEYWALMAGGFAAIVIVTRRKKKPPSVTS